MLRVSVVLSDKKQARDFMRAAAAKEGDDVGADGMSADGAEPIRGARSIGSSDEAALAAAAEDVRPTEEVIAEAMEAIKISLESAAKERRESRGRTDAVGGFPAPTSPGPTGIGRSRVPDAWDGHPPHSPSSPGAATGRRDPSTMDASELRGELERLRRYALRLQHRREDAVRGAMESENAAHRAREERDELVAVARARAEAAEAAREETVEKFRILRAETHRLREDAENLRKVNRALSRELYGSRDAQRHEQVTDTSTRTDLKRVFDAIERGEGDVVDAYLRESGVAAAALRGVGALEGSAAKSDQRRRRDAPDVPGSGKKFASAPTAGASGSGSGGGFWMQRVSFPSSPLEKKVEPPPPTERGFWMQNVDFASSRSAEKPAWTPPLVVDPGTGTAPGTVPGTVPGTGQLPPVPGGFALGSSASPGAASKKSPKKSRRDATSSSSTVQRADDATFSTFPAPRLERDEWRVLDTPSSGTVHVRSVAVLRRNYPGGAFGPPRRSENDPPASARSSRGADAADATSSSKFKEFWQTVGGAPPQPGTAPAGSKTQGGTSVADGEDPEWFRGARFAWDESVAEARAAQAAAAEAAEARELRKLRASGVAAASPLRLPAHLRARDAPGTAEDVDKAVRRFVKLFADAGVSVSLRRQAPFKYVLEPAPSATGTKSKSSASKRPQAKMVMIKLEQHRLVVHRGGANRAVVSRAGLANRIIAPRDLADEVMPYAAPYVAPRRAAKLAPGLGPNRDWLSPANAGGLAGGTPFSGSVPQPPPHVGGMNVRSDMTFVPPPSESRRGANNPFGSSPSPSPSPSPSKKLDAVFGSLPDSPPVGGFGSAPRPAGLRPFLHLEGSPAREYRDPQPPAVAGAKNPFATTAAMAQKVEVDLTAGWQGGVKSPLTSPAAASKAPEEVAAKYTDGWFGSPPGSAAAPGGGAGGQFVFGASGSNQGNAGAFSMGSSAGSGGKSGKKPKPKGHHK